MMRREKGVAGASGASPQSCEGTGETKEKPGATADEDLMDGSGCPPKPGKPAPKEEAAYAGNPPADESESESSDSSAKPPSPRRPSRGPDPSVKPLNSKPMDSTPKGKVPSSDKSKPSAASALVTEKRKRQEVENREPGEAAANGASARRRKNGGQTSRALSVTASPSKTGSGSAVAKRLVMGDEDAGTLYPWLREAIHLLEVEDGNILPEGSVNTALEMLKSAETKALEERWKKHLAAGFKYFLERAALKEDLLKSLVEVLESQ